MRTWLHFIGRAYYTRSKFIRESTEHDVTRRVSLQDLKRMSWGDRVVLCMWEDNSTLVFGQIMIERISGLSLETITRIKESVFLNKVSDGGKKIARGCGSYVVGCAYAVSMSIQKMCEFLKENPTDKFMIGGKFRETKVVKLKNVPHRMGFREFDYSKYEEALTAAFSEKRGKFPVVEGQFYVNKKADMKSAEKKEGQLQEVADYQKISSTTPD